MLLELSNDSYWNVRKLCYSSAVIMPNGMLEVVLLELSNDAY